MNFWILAIALLVVPAVVISWPLFTGSAKDRITGLFIVLMIPLSGILLYQNIGTPAAINMSAAPVQQSEQEQPAHSSQADQMNDLVASLQQRMRENPDDPEGWLILGRSLKTMQRYAEAKDALSNANRLTPDNPMLMIELAEASLFASGQSQVSPEIRQLIEAALVIDPQQQKGLWLLGMAAAQDGDNELAIASWQKLLDQLDPASGAAASVSQQMDLLKTGTGQEVTKAVTAKTVVPETVVPEPVVAEFGIPVNISIADDLVTTLPGNAVLFVFIQPAGAVGMPLAVKRMAARGFPMALNFTDADLLRPGTSLKDFEQVDISARVSMSGVANAAPGDFQASLVTVDTKSVTGVDLHLDQRVP